MTIAAAHQGIEPGLHQALRSETSAEVASSRINPGAFFNARAIAMSWLAARRRTPFPPDERR